MSLHAIARYVGNCVFQFIWNYPWPGIIPRFINLHCNAQSCIARLYPCPHHCFKKHSVFQISQILQSKPSKRTKNNQRFWIRSVFLNAVHNTIIHTAQITLWYPLYRFWPAKHLTQDTIRDQNAVSPKPESLQHQSLESLVHQQIQVEPPGRTGQPCHRLHSSWHGDVNTNYCRDHQKNMKRVNFCRETGCHFTAEFRSSHPCRTWTIVRQRQKCPLGSAKVGAWKRNQGRHANYFHSWSQLA